MGIGMMRANRHHSPIFDELFELFGERREDHIEFRELTPWYRFVFPDGDQFDYGGTLENTLAEIGRIEPKDQAGYGH